MSTRLRPRLEDRWSTDYKSHTTPVSAGHANNPAGGTSAMEHYCGSCGRPISGQVLTCVHCNPGSGKAMTQSMVNTSSEPKKHRTGSAIRDAFVLIGALFLLEGTLPSWADKLYLKLLPLSFGRIQPDEAPSAILTLAAWLAAILFAVWLHNRWSQLRRLEGRRIPGWLAVLLCLVPVVSVVASIYFVATLRHRFSEAPGPLLISRFGMGTWAWWATYHLSVLAAGINAANGSSWAATCILFGLSCWALALIVAEVGDSRAP